MSEKLNAVELKAFSSVSNSIRCLGTNSSLLCRLPSSWLQQRIPNTKLKDLVDQISILKVLKEHGIL